VLAARILGRAYVLFVEAREKEKKNHQLPIGVVDYVDANG